MINEKYENILKVVSQLEVEVISDGIMFLFIENRTIKWKVASKKFDIHIFKEETIVPESFVSVRAMMQRETITENVSEEKYGQRLIITAIPIINDSNVPIGAFLIAIPKIHPIVASFSEFAPIISELFPGGSLLYLSNLTKIVDVKASQKFTLPIIPVGHEMNETDIAYKTIKSGKAQIEVGKECFFGTPAFVASYPLYDDSGENVVSTLNVVIPKDESFKLMTIIENLSSSLDNIATTVEQLASNAININEKEENLYIQINFVSETLKKMDNITQFISSVANQSNMLGLNASIEASRAGEVGKGFLVVANQIRKLSNQSKETGTQIKALIDDIKYKIDEVNKKSNESLTLSEEQASATQVISASVEELSAIANELNRMVKNI